MRFQGVLTRIGGVERRQTILFISSRVREMSMLSCQATRRIVGRSNRRLGFSSLLLFGVAGVYFAPDGRLSPTTPTSFYNFTGGISTDWAVAGNWTNVADGTMTALPGAGSTADIAGGKTAVVGTVANPNPTINVEQESISGGLDLHGPPDPANPDPTPPPPFLQYPAPGVGNGELDQNAGTINFGVVDPANTTTNNGSLIIGQSPAPLARTR